MKRAIVGIAVTVILGAFVYIAAVSLSPEGTVNGEKLMVALQRYCADQRAAGIQLQGEVSVRELVARGYLNPVDVSGFKGMDVAISLDINDETRQQEVLVRVRFPDGSVEAVMGDGSIQLLK